MATTLGQFKLAKHRDKAVKDGISPSEYAKLLGLSPQRVSAICCGKALGRGLTLVEAIALRDRARIRVDDWFRPAAS